MNSFKSTLLILPGLNNSGEGHWQTLWEQELGCIRVIQKDWDHPNMEDWIAAIENTVSSKNPAEVILIAHSLSCCSVAFWAAKYKRQVRGAFLVGPSDTEAPTYPPGTSGFKPMPLNRLPFPSMVVSSSDDYYVSMERASFFAQAWGSEWVNIGPAGHFNLASGFGPWPLGLELLGKFEQSLTNRKLYI